MLSLETFIIFSLFAVKVSGASKQKSSCRTSSSSTALTGNDFFMHLITISAAAFDFSYFPPTFETFLFFLRTGILIRLNLEFTYACSTFNVNPFSFFVAEYNLSSVLYKVSFSSLITSELSSISKVMFYFCNNSSHSDGMLDRELLRLAISVANFAFSVW